MNGQPLLIYTDGGCWPNPGGISGYCAILVKDNEVLDKVTGAEENSTNNRAELLAIIAGLKLVPVGSSVTVVTDSQYCKQGASVWSHKWETRGWLNVKNVDLWRQLCKLRDERNVTWTWIKGHCGNKWNEMCDLEASKAAEKHKMDSIRTQRLWKIPGEKLQVENWETAEE